PCSSPTRARSSCTATRACGRSSRSRTAAARRSPASPTSSPDSCPGCQPTLPRRSSTRRVPLDTRRARSTGTGRTWPRAPTSSPTIRSSRAASTGPSRCCRCVTRWAAISRSRCRSSPTSCRTTRNRWRPSPRRSTRSSRRSSSRCRAICRSSRPTCWSGSIRARGSSVPPTAGRWRPAGALYRDGKLATGDVGEWTAEHSLKLVDRKKDILITAGGKNVSPSLVENRLRASPYISEAAVFGEARKYLVALLEADGETVAEWARERGVVHTGYASLVGHPDVLALIDAEVRRANDELTRVEQVKAFRLLPRELDPEVEGEPVTPTRKVKRRLMAERYGTLVESMYGGDEERRIAAEVATGRLSL